MSACTPIKSLPYSVIAAIYLPALAVLAFCFAASELAGIPLPVFFRDPTVTLGGHPLTGMQSNVGVIVWITASGICLFTSAIIYTRPGGRSAAAFFFWGGLLGTVLSLDDLFVFHEDLAQSYFNLDEKIVVGAYGLAAIAFLYKFRQTILDSDRRFLSVAAMFFVASLAIDYFMAGSTSPLRIAAEDGFKLLGIVSWSAYFIQQCFRQIRFADHLP